MKIQELVRQLVTGLCFLSAIVASAEARIWTDAQGRTVEAEYKGVDSGKVLLMLGNGNTIPFPFAKLSAEDQSYVKKVYGLNPHHAAKQIDGLVDAKLAKEGLEPNPLTTDEEFVRRIYLEITGSIPTFDQTLAFLESGERDKRATLIDELLESEGFVSHSFNWYADQLRIVSRTNDLFIFENYIDWVKTAIRDNQPFDRFVYDLLTSEGRLWDDPASGYFIRDRGMPLDNLSTTVGLFLGTEITCAQCHDHPFEDWTQMDFYQLAAFLGQRRDKLSGREFWTTFKAERDRIEAQQRALDPTLGPTGFVQPFRQVLNANIYQVWDDEKKSLKLPHDYKYEDGEPEAEVTPRTIFGEEIDPSAYETPRIAFATWLTSKDNPMFSITIANRLWSRAFGLGLHEPLDNIHEIRDAQNPELLRYMAQYFEDLDFNVKEFLRAIYYSEAWQRQATLDGPTLAQIAKNDYHFPGPVLKRMSAEQLWDSFLTLTVPDPMRYRREVAGALTEQIKIDPRDVDGADSIERTKKLAELQRRTINDGAPSLAAWRKKYTAKNEDGSMIKVAGAYLARSSEINQPARSDHFLAAWGQSDRQLVNNANFDGSIPQILTMINGAFTQMLIKPDSLIFKTSASQRGSGNKMENIYLSILSRYPVGKEKVLAQRIIRREDEGYGDLIWALVNTREFIFIK